jgi:hypothetical protein
MGLKGPSNPRSIQQSLRRTLGSIGADVAKRAAPELTVLTRVAFGSNTTVYDKARPAGVDGQALSLVKSGATRAALGFVNAAGTTIVKCVLPTAWAKFLIGKYKILPSGTLPAAWRRRLTQVVAQTKVGK